MWKTSKYYQTFTPSKNFICVCMYKMDLFALFTANAWRKNDVEVIENGGEIWINQKSLEKNLVLHLLPIEISINLTNLKQ